MRFCFIFMLTLMMPVLASAQNKVDEVGIEPERNTPVSEWMAAENKLIDTLNDDGKEAFLVMRNKHSVIRAVKIVRRDVSDAVKACGKENPEIKKSMRDRFAAWEKAIMPILKDAQKYLDTEIEQQQLVYPSDFKHVLQLNDKAYDYADNKVIKQVVSDKAACERLLASMDETENKLVDILEETLIPEDVIRERVKE